MLNMDAFRVFFAVILLTAFAMSSFFRRRARQSETIARRREGWVMLTLRLALALPFFLALVGYIVNPRWMEWSALALPEAARWAGVVIGLAALPPLYWVFQSIGSNISETVLTKTEHRLVTHGPYRWVRHPLYTLATVAFLALGLIAANAFILLMATLLFAGLALFVVPKEEAQLLRAFGEDYLRYQCRTGPFLPRLVATAEPPASSPDPSLEA